ncbi:MAG: hydrogenase nickel incorporation protein HypB [Rhodobacteraceae bacterium]|jgi:hydrogenase nickel incorporation protein HypB|nr:hydrogenase nickel incorporation protein HypB [Paracoccaceae bacterium]
MCTTCGCGAGETRIEGGHAHMHRHADGTVHAHHHHHDHPHPHEDDRAPGHDDHDHHHHGPGGTIHYGRGPAGNSVPGLGQTRLVAIEADVLARNDALAAANRARLARARTLALNLVSSPGAGKTTLLVETLRRMAGVPVAVIEGDQETSTDAERIRAAGAPAVQVNTGKGCHLDAAMVGHALDHLPAVDGGVVFIENVGNLVCPAAFDLGESARVVIASVTEGEDKPLKYPGIFATADLLLVSKSDLLPHVDCDTELLIANARRVRPGLAVIRISARTGEGLEDWLAWIDAGRRMARLRG